MKLCSFPSARRFELRSAFALRIFSRKIIFIEQCRSVCGRSDIAFSREGVVTANGSCCASFLRKHSRRAYPFRLLTPFAATFPKGTASVVMGTFISTTKGVPLRADFPRPGEDVTAGDKRGNLALRSKD